MCQTILIDNLSIRIINSQYPTLLQKLNKKYSTIEYTNYGLKTFINIITFSLQISLFFSTAHALWVRPTWRQVRPTSYASALTSDLHSKHTETRVHSYKFTTHLLSTVNRSNSITSYLPQLSSATRD